MQFHWPSLAQGEFGDCWVTRWRDSGVGVVGVAWGEDEEGG